MDEARHVEVFAKYLQEKQNGFYPINAHLKLLLDDIINDSRWDMTYLGMQIMVEGLALAAFGFIHQLTTEPLLKQLLRMVMSDEARHVAFGVLSLKEYYAELSDAELRDRQEFAFEAAVRMRDRFLQQEVWERMGLDAKTMLPLVVAAPQRQLFQTMLFSKIVPNCKKLGLLDANGGWLRGRFTELGVIGFGRIGRALATRAIALGFEVCAVDPHLPDEAIAGYGVHPLTLDEAVESCEVFSLHSLLTDETRGMIGAEEIAKMPRGALLVDTARAALVDFDAVLGALDSGHLAGAAFDVLPVEPPSPEVPAPQRPTLIVNPHAAWYSTATEHEAYRRPAVSVREALEGRRPTDALAPYSRFQRRYEMTATRGAPGLSSSGRSVRPTRALTPKSGK